jgi:two-component system chemotaxis response regulator CheB
LSRIRVAVADDSTFLRQAVARMLADEEGIALAGLASSGEELLDHLDRWRPDVIILDLSMPGIGGLATLDAVMARRPTPVLILSTHSKKDAPLTIEALHRGALDFIDKQEYSLVDFERLRAALLDKIRHLTGHRGRGGPGAGRRGGGGEATARGAGGERTAGVLGGEEETARLPADDEEAGARAAAGTGRAADGEAAGTRAAAGTRRPADGGDKGARAAAGGRRTARRGWTDRQPAELLLLGASTGGPPAIETILRDLGAGLPVPVVVVQHMPAGFTRSFADRLNACLPMPVREAAHEELLATGTVYVAPGGIHIRLVRGREGLRALLSAAPGGGSHRPSLDLVFASAAAAVGERVVAAVLTGMGHDGAAGMAALVLAGAHTIGQDEATSAVYGMPRAAVAAGGVCEVLPLERIGPRLRELLGGR